MGADGHITIWRRSKAMEVFQEADRLFELLPNCYRQSFEGSDLYHAYYGDNMQYDWRAFEDWAHQTDGYPPLDRQLEFYRWLKSNAGEQWEVWT